MQSEQGLRQRNISLHNELNPSIGDDLRLESNGSRVNVIRSRSGEPSAEVEGIKLHSLYDPRREAEQVVQRHLADSTDDTVVIIFGIGLGYIAESVRQRCGGLIIVVEPAVEIAQAAFEHRDLSPLQGVHFIIGRSPQAAIKRLFEIVPDSRMPTAAIIPHAPSMKLNARYFNDLRHLIETAKSGTSGYEAGNYSGSLGILVATPVYGGSLPIAQYCSDALAGMGHHVIQLDNSIYHRALDGINGLTNNRGHRRQLTELLTTLMAESITATALDRAVDLVFLVAQSPITPPVVKELHERGIPVAFWFMEDWRIFGYWRETAPMYDYFFTIQTGDFFDHLRDAGVRNAHYLPLAADPCVHKPLDLSTQEQEEFGSLLSHVGAGYRNRRLVFSGLNDIDFKLWGNDWDDAPMLGGVLQRNGSRLSTEDSVKVFNATAINLNLHSSPYHDGVNPDGDYVNPRTFELAACGAFQIVDRRRLLGDLFEEGSEIVTFEHESRIRGLVETYAKDPSERRRIADNARRRALQEHTYEHRMQDMISFMFGQGFVPASRMHPNHIDNLIADAEGDDELLQLLNRFKDRGVITLDDIIEDLRSRDGEMSRAEAIFLLMYEFRQWAREKDAA